MKTAVLLIHFARPDLTFNVIKQLRNVPNIWVINNGPGIMDPFVNSFIELIQPSENMGYVGGVNYGMKYLSDEGFEAIWVLNIDINGVNKQMLAELSSALENNPKLAAVSPSIENNPHYVMHPSPDSGVRIVRYIDFPAPLVRVSAWNEVGGFDPNLVGYGCDIDVCLRWRQAGWEVGVLGNRTITHQMGATVCEPGAIAGHSDLHFMNEYLKNKWKVNDWREIL